MFWSKSNIFAQLGDVPQGSKLRASPMATQSLLQKSAEMAVSCRMESSWDYEGRMKVAAGY